jgi:hypothetical protein
MRSYRVHSWIAGIAAALLTAAVLYFAISSASADPAVVKVPASAMEQTEELMSAVCEGRFDDVQPLLSGVADLGIQPLPEGTPESLLWDAWVGSLSYEFLGDCYATPNGLARDVEVWGLDMQKTTQQVGAEAQLLAQERIAALEGAELPESFADQILYDATARVLEQPLLMSEWTVTLELEYEQGRWMIIPSTRLQALLSGQIR